MKNKYFFPIYKLKAKSWIRYWLLKKTEFKGKLSEILSGFTFNLQNTLRQKFVKFEIQGHSEQETTEGYQLLDINDALNGYFTNNRGDLNGSIEGFHTDKYIDVSGYNNIYFRYEALDNIKLGRFWIQEYDENKNSIQRTGAGIYDTVFSKGQVKTHTQLLNENTKYIRISSYSIQLLINGSYVIQTPEKDNWNNLMKTTVSFSNVDYYEPYTGGIASPNPNYEQPIKSAGDNVNLFDKDNANIINANIANAKIGKVNTCRTLYIPCEPNMAYTMQKKAGARFQFGCTSVLPDFGVNVDNLKVNQAGTTLTVTTNADSQYLVAFFYADGTDTVPYQEMLDSIKIEKGTVATPYSPYGMGSITEKIVNRNLWTSEWEQGYIDANGGLINNNAHIRTKDYIYFEPGQHYAIKRSIYTTYMNVRGYDKNKKFVGIGDACINLIQGSSTATPMNTINTCVISTKPGIYYLKFNDASNDLTTQYMMVKGDTPEDYIEHEEQTYSVYTQQPMRSIGDVRDGFVKINGVWNEKHLPYIASYNGEELPQDVYNEVGRIKYCNDKSMSTTGQFSTGASVQYIDESNWTYIPCTQSQIDILENLPSTFAGQTNVFSEDEVKAFLKIQYWESDTNG